MPPAKKSIPATTAKKQATSQKQVPAALLAPTTVPSGAVETVWYALTPAAESFRDKWAAAHKSEYEKYDQAIAPKTPNERAKLMQAWQKNFEKRWQVEERKDLPGTRGTPGWLKVYFGPLTHIPWCKPAPAPPMPHLSASPDDLLTAVLSCGYGLCDPKLLANAPSHTLWSAPHFSAHWLLRANFALSFLDQSTLQPQGFCKWLETSEKTTPSFVMGGLFSFLAAKEWLKAGGLALRGYFHYGQYSESLLSSRKEFFKEKKPLRGSGKAPDYIALDTAYGVHLFEAKGGEERYRVSAVKHGLAQLSAAPRYARMEAWLNLHQRKILSSAVVFARFDAGKKLTVTVYDPPMRASPPSPSPGGELAFLPAVAFALSRNDAEAFFLSLPLPDVEWRGLSWRRLHDRHIGFAKRQIDRKTRDALNAYLEIQDMLPESPQTLHGKNALSEVLSGSSNSGQSAPNIRSLRARASVGHFLERAIAEGQYQPRQRLPPVTLLSELLGVSRSTVGRALQLLALNGTLRRSSDGRGYEVLGPEDGSSSELIADSSALGQARSESSPEPSWKDELRQFFADSRHHTVVDCAVRRAEFPKEFLIEVAVELKLEDLEHSSHRVDAQRVKKLQIEHPELDVTATQGGLLIATFPNGEIPHDEQAGKSH